MNDEAENKITQLVSEAAMKQKSVHADTKGVIHISGDFDWHLWLPMQ